MFKARILFVGADAHLAELTSAILERRGARIAVAGSMDTLIALVEQNRPQLLILDQRQAEKRSGVEACAFLRRIFTRKEIPILFLARSGDEDIILQSMEAGANECLTVPYKAHELLAKTALLIRRKRKEESRRLTRSVIRRVIGGENVDLGKGIPFGENVLLEVLGRGSMGAVFKACQNESNEVAALKILDPEINSDGRALRRLQREGRVLTSIRHPHVVSVHGVSRCEGFYYLVMEYVEGDSVIRRIERHYPAPAFKPEEVIDLLFQIVSALEAVWEAGLVHRDVKPENIMILPDGTAKLVDFGLARRDGDEPLTRSGIIYGTPNYMSPEQIQGLDLDPRTDIYSLGATAYHMLTGSAPFDGPSTRSILYRHVFEDLRSPEMLDPAIPRAAGAVICRMMEKEPEDRYGDGRELRRALEHTREALAMTREKKEAVTRR